MNGFQEFFAVVSAVVLFLFGLQGFSRELQAVGGDALRSWLERVTASRWRGFLLGALVTAIVQSSSAVTALAVALVDANVISFRASLGVLLGANVGSTSTGLIASLGMKPVARATAMANFLFNAVGLLLYFPFLALFSRVMVDSFGGAALAVAWAHLTFNLTVGLLFLSTLGRVEHRLAAWFLAAHERS